MSGYHALAVEVELDAAEVIRTVYGLGDGEKVVLVEDLAPAPGESLRVSTL